VKRFRRGAEYLPDSLAFIPIDCNQRIRIIITAEALERRTKGKGRKSGVLGQSGLRVLRCLLFDFCAIPTGRCCPSYEAIREKTGFCKSTISGALQRLEAAGLVRIIRRIIRTPLGARQTSNAYAFFERAFGERKPDYDNSTEIANLKKKERNQLPLPCIDPVPFSIGLKLALRRLGETMGASREQMKPLFE
jgi:Helix-turn-helix domain